LNWVTGGHAQAAPRNRVVWSFRWILGTCVLDERVLTVEEAIRKMTSRRATRVGQADCDILRVGMIADVMAFEPVTIPYVATVDHPNPYSAGVHPSVGASLWTSNPTYFMLVKIALQACGSGPRLVNSPQPSPRIVCEGDRVHDVYNVPGSR
jgi:hypothetical protein